MDYLPSVVRAQYRGAYRIHVTFNDQSEGTIDFRRWLKGPVFEPLKDLDNFRRFFVDGGTVAWPNGADIAPETLYDAARGTRRPNTRLQRGSAGSRKRGTRRAHSKTSRKSVGLPRGSAARRR
jgi:hypothetical protein